MVKSTLKNKDRKFKLTTFGFTLIELLAVIVILAIIALIAVPIVLNIIDDSKKEAAKISADNYIDAVELAIARKNLEDEFNPSSCEIQSSNGTSNLLCDGEKLNVEIDGSIPSSGWLSIDDAKIKEYSLYVDNSTVTQKDGNVEIIVGKDATEKIIYKCKRATQLHEEICEQTSTSYYCSGAGYTSAGSKGTTTIRYGNETTTKGNLVSGDAFDCDVDGNGKYDATTERFYYVTDLDKETAVLIYYNNVISGVANNTNDSVTAYNESRKGADGPETAVLSLPTTDQWSNVSLKNTQRSITNDAGTELISFSYKGYAARLLTLNEISAACGEFSIDSMERGDLDSCKYLLENTAYSSNSMGSNGYWLETPKDSGIYVWSVYSDYRYIELNNADYPMGNGSNYNNDNGVRPVIEVSKSDISY